MNKGDRANWQSIHKSILKDGRRCTHFLKEMLSFHFEKKHTHILTHRHNRFAVTVTLIARHCRYCCTTIFFFSFFFYNKDSEVYQDELSLTHADPVVMLPWTFGEQWRGSGGKGCSGCVTRWPKLVLPRWLIIGWQSNGFWGFEPMRERERKCFVNSCWHAHTHTRVTNYTKISLAGVWVCACSCVCVYVCRGGDNVVWWWSLTGTWQETQFWCLVNNTFPLFNVGKIQF